MTDCRSTVSLWRRARDIGEKAVERYHRLGWKGKLVFWLWIGLYLFAGIIALVIGPNKVFAWFASLADKIRSLSFAWAIFVALSFPPMIGFGTAQTLVGFALSLWPGFLVAAASCLLGSALAFLLIRLFASSISRFPAFQALSQAVTSKGRGFQSVLLPKVFLYVFIGDRMYKFADPESRGEMDTLSKWLNATSIGVSAIVAVGASYYVYKITIRYTDLSQADLKASRVSTVADGNSGGAAPQASTSEEEWGESDSSHEGGTSGDEAIGGKASSDEGHSPVDHSVLQHGQYRR
uniref:BY PROTMAP: gi/472582977/gb/EMS20639.1/ Golgi apparatus membrane protein tvp38 [Rhodosporidium toruloides NP11] n=1 Tax=Rhodotorula toruloides TaxID=5286 RepID=A0A0K3CPF7_RHOTO